MVGFLVGALGFALGVVAGLSTLVLLLVATQGGGSLGLAFGVLLGGLPAVAIGGVVGVFLSLRILRHIRNSPVSSRGRRRQIAFAVTAACCIMALPGLASMSCSNSLDPPSDANMIANFDAHEKALSRVVEMAAKDKKLIRVDDDWTDPHEPADIGIAPERIDEYRSLMAGANVPRGFQADPDSKEVAFMYWGIGCVATDELEKGYAYLAKPPANVSSRLDGINLEGTSRQVVYRSIRGHWYLYLEYLP